MPDSLVFIHLSDIHFNKRWHDEFELDKDLRDQLELDVRRVLSNFEAVRGVLISGDIAYAGRIDDYRIAKDWLKTLTDSVKCGDAAVWCVPGNHDVDQTVFDGSYILQVLHGRLRPKNVDEIDDHLSACMRDAESAKAITRSIENYNAEFASKFSCPSRARPLYWQHDISLNDKSILRLHGINSTLVSHKDDEEKKLIVGTIQVTPKEDPGVVCLAVCHHPPDWLLDHEAVNHNLTARARIQVFGHKHIQRIEEINGCLRIGAGAVHPSRKEKKWKPRYNWIELTVQGAADARTLKVRIFPRVWSDAKPEYVADTAICDKGEEFKTYNLVLPSWTPAVPPVDSSVVESHASAGRVPTTGPVSLTSGSTMDAARTLTYRFLTLPHVSRLEIAQNLNLIENEDEGLRDFDLLERVFIRATERTQLEKLWQMIEAKHGDDKHPLNPYVGQ